MQKVGNILVKREKGDDHKEKGVEGEGEKGRKKKRKERKERKREEGSLWAIRERFCSVLSFFSFSSLLSSVLVVKVGE